MNARFSGSQPTAWLIRLRLKEVSTSDNHGYKDDEERADQPATYAPVSSPPGKRYVE